MKLILAIVPGYHSQAILKTLTTAQYRATVISTTGGWLRKGSTTLLLGVEDDQVDDVLKQIQLECLEVLPKAKSLESCATVLVLGVQQHVQI